MLMADVMEAVGIKRGDYIIRVNNRKILDGLMDAIGIGGEEYTITRLNVFRSLDKLDKFPRDQIALLLGIKGRKDDSGDFTKGAGLDDKQIDDIFRFLDHAEKISDVYYPDAFRLKDTDQVHIPYKHVRDGLQ